jgi:hypothetical protein
MTVGEGKAEARGLHDKTSWDTDKELFHQPPALAAQGHCRYETDEGLDSSVAIRRIHCTLPHLVMKPADASHAHKNTSSSDMLQSNTCGKFRADGVRDNSPHTYPLPGTSTHRKRKQMVNLIP